MFTRVQQLIHTSRPSMLTQNLANSIVCVSTLFLVGYIFSEKGLKHGTHSFQVLGYSNTPVLKQ